MLIQLKQPEIEAALKLFISQQGINLAGKGIDITFTAGRKESGLIADICIQDVSIPGFTDSFVVHAVPNGNGAAKPVEAGPQDPNEAAEVAGSMADTPTTKPISLFK